MSGGRGSKEDQGQSNAHLHLLRFSAATVYIRRVGKKRKKKIQKNGSKEQETVQTFEYKYIYKYIDKPMNIVYIFFGLLCFPPVHRFAYFIGLLLLSTRTGLKMIL